MYIFKTLSLLLLALVALSACETRPMVYSDFDPRHDFSKDRTFTWVHTPPMLRAGDYPVSDLAETRMTAAIKGELIIKGYTFVDDPADADFSVVYTMGARDKISIVSRPSGFYGHRYDWGWGAYYFPYFLHFPFDRGSRSNEEVKFYTQGDIAIDIFDSDTKQPIWHTNASKRLSKKDLDSDAKNAAEIAMTLLKHFPWKGCKVEVSDECQPFD